LKTMDRLRVLVTDDEREMRRAVERALSGYTVQLQDVNGEVGFEVEQASSGEEALERIAQCRPDIHLLDHKMGGMSGLEVLQKLDQNESEMLTVMITAYASLETAVAATKRGAFDFIAKPFTPAELKETIRKASGHLLAQRRARQLAAEKRQLRFQFISVLAHELKAPLGAIEGYLTILKDPAMRGDEAQVATMVQRCLVRSQGMRKLIYDLLDLTRIESGLKKRQIAEVDAVEAARASIETLAPEVGERGIEVALHAEGSAVMRADASELEIILNNLVSNAVKYNRDGGRVDVTVGSVQDEVRIRVADTGIGMSEAEIEKLFREFVRIKNAKTKHILGSGLGLSTVKRLVEMYGGTVQVQSVPDEGSTFEVRLKKDAAQRSEDDDAQGAMRLAAGD